MNVHSPLRAAKHGGRGSSRAFPFELDEADITCASRSAACVLFSGGKTARLLAERIHDESGWRWGPFQVVDCGAPQATLDRLLFSPLEADLWPVESTKPVLRLLQPGTMFLQEVGQLSTRAQVQLRDLIELASNEANRRRSRRRIMASTSERLLPRVAAGTFDETLFYRLNAIHFVLSRDPRVQRV
jgi:DNA-binding NtrC family response regulator